MKKIACKISALLCAAAMLTAFLPALGVSAAAQTKKFLDPMEDSTFPKAYSVKTILPANYDVPCVPPNVKDEFPIVRDPAKLNVVEWGGVLLN